jgi:hypothetical protein
VNHRKQKSNTQPWQILLPEDVTVDKIPKTIAEFFSDESIQEELEVLASILKTEDQAHLSKSHALLAQYLQVFRRAA